MAKDGTFADLPEWVQARCLATTPPAKALESVSGSGALLRRARKYIAGIDGAGEGGRNATVFSAAGNVAALEGEHGERLGEGEIVAELRALNARCTPPLPDDELAAAVHSALNNGTPRAAKLPTLAGGDGAGGEAEAPPMMLPVNFADLATERPERGPAVIDGILREGAVAVLASGTKCRKTWVVLALAAAGMSAGRVQWLGHSVAPGRVLLIDGELTPAAIHFRVRKVCEALRVGEDAFANLDVYALRGRTKDAARAMAYARSKPPGYYKIIIIDPQYVFYPDDPRFSENDNAAMRRFFDGLIQFAGETRAGVVVIHHSSKGAQNEKSIADVGAGAGAISRSVDAHLILRPHAEKDCVVFDGVLRDFPELAATCWRYLFPTFIDAPELDPTDLAGGRKRRSATAEFMEGGKPTKPQWTAETFAKRFIGEQGKALARLQAEAASEDIPERRTKSLTEQAAAMGLAYIWPGKTGVNGTPKRYANKPCPLVEVGV